MDAILQALTPLVIAIIGWLAFRAKILINEKIKSEKYNLITTRLTTAAESAAKHVAQVYTDDLRAASKDGKLTAEEKKNARDQALAVLLQDLGKSASEELFDWMKFSSPKERDEFLASQIEAAIATIKQTGSKPTSAPKKEVAHGTPSEK